MAVHKKPTVSGFLEANEKFAKTVEFDDDPATFWTKHVREVVSDLNASIVSLKYLCQARRFMLNHALREDLKGSTGASLETMVKLLCLPLFKLLIFGRCVYRSRVNHYELKKVRLIQALAHRKSIKGDRRNDDR